VIPAESYSLLPSADARLGAVALLQQKAAWLEAEIAERKAAEAKLRLALESEQAARAASEEALRLRNEFLSVAAHELRTPLTTLLGYSQLLPRWLKQEGQLRPEQIVQIAQAMAGQSDKLARLVNQLLDVARVESGKLQLERRPAELVKLVEEVVAAARLRSDRRTISLEAPASLEAPIDPLRLEQVLTNLLDNAIRYSPEDSPIEVRLSSRDGAVAELAVRDHGPGIAPEEQRQVFERFYHAHANGQRGGMGLGLYISRQIVELHGGTIRVELPADGGSRFVVCLPLAGEQLPTQESSVAAG
jgi:signal transduction histidine kinase